MHSKPSYSTLKVLLSNIKKLIIFMHVCICATAHVGRSEDNLQVFVLSTILVLVTKLSLVGLTAFTS